MSEVHCCPVCRGKGIVSNGFYNGPSYSWTSSSTAPETCRSCAGKGYVVVGRSNATPRVERGTNPNSGVQAVQCDPNAEYILMNGGNA